MDLRRTLEAALPPDVPRRMSEFVGRPVGVRAAAHGAEMVFQMSRKDGYWLMPLPLLLLPNVRQMLLLHRRPQQRAVLFLLQPLK